MSLGVILRGSVCVLQARVGEVGAGRGAATALHAQPATVHVSTQTALHAPSRVAAGRGAGKGVERGVERRGGGVVDAGGVAQGAGVRAQARHEVHNAKPCLFSWETTDSSAVLFKHWTERVT